LAKALGPNVKIQHQVWRVEASLGSPEEGSDAQWQRVFVDDLVLLEPNTLLGVRLALPS
jgi:hypothetical protein